MKSKVYGFTLEGLDGAFALMGAWSREARRQNWSGDEIEAVLKEAMSSDYLHLVAVLLEHTEPGGPPVDECNA